MNQVRKGGIMSRISASRSKWAVLLTLALVACLTGSAQAGLVLQLSSSSTSVNSSMTITTAGTYTFYLFVEVSDGNSTSYSGNYINQVMANIVSTSNTALSTSGTSGISGFTIDGSWLNPLGAGTATTALGVAGAGSWGSNTSSTNSINALDQVIPNSNGLNTLHAGGSNGFAVNSYTWAFLVGTATLTINQADLLGGTGTVDYAAQIPTFNSTKAKWWQTNKGTTAQTITNTSTSSTTSGPTQSPAFVITYNAPETGSATMTLAALSVPNQNQTIILSGSATFTAVAGNSGTATLTGATLGAAWAAPMSGTSTFSINSLTGSGTQTQQLDVSVTPGVGALGTSTLTWHATGTGNSTATPGDVYSTLTVLAHAGPSLTGTSASIGSVLGNAVVTVQTNLQNAANPNGAALQVTGLSAGLSGTATGALIAQGASTTLTALVNTSTASYSPGSFTANVADDQTYAGKGATPLADQTLTVAGTIGFASATSNSSFGPALSATVNGPAGSPSAPLFSKVDNTGASSGALGTQASILGSTGTAGTVTMTWRQANAAELSNTPPIISDVVRLGGTALPEGTLYVLEMSFDPNNYNVAGHLAQLAAAGKIYLVSNAGGNWHNAVLDNAGAGADAGLYPNESYADFLAAHPGDTLAQQLGAWGVNQTPDGTGQDVVWAVLNHASDFAVVPEPATLAFLLLGGLALSATALRRHAAKR